MWQTASLYHLVHTAALVSAPSTKYPNIVSFLFFLCFSSLCSLIVDGAEISFYCSVWWLVDCWDCSLFRHVSCYLFVSQIPQFKLLNGCVGRVFVLHVCLDVL